ncbi:MAG TPA: metallophosphoesterase family protein [Candidatus Methylomirabilis sp.]|nr:metallophosphoesterase family protein [Candidatus Methylomirabilis sp.]
MRMWLRRSPPTPEGPATYVIGDIHGCAQPLERLLRKIAPGSEDRLIFIGDYIDRGPHSREVVELLLGLPHRCIFLLGNHEKMLLDYLAGGDSDLYLLNGGLSTLESYGGDPANIPQAHLSFFRSLRPMYDTPDYLFVHAGIRPLVPLEQQAVHDLVWIRQEFYQFVGRFPKPVVFGHTPMRHVLLAEDRIGIDTGCVYGGKLTCLRLPERAIIQVPGRRH